MKKRDNRALSWAGGRGYCGRRGAGGRGGGGGGGGAGEGVEGDGSGSMWGSFKHKSRCDKALQ